MTNALKFNKFNCIEWVLKSPLGRSPNGSDIFYFRGRQCTLECRLAFNGYTCLYFKCKEKLQPPITVTTWSTINGIFEHKRTESVKGENEEIWSCKGDLSGYSLVWKIILEDDISQEEKCIQTGSYLNGNVSSESLPDDFSKLLESGSNHDVEMKCGELSLKAHKDVLCSRSEVFKKMLQSDFLEGRTAVVEIRDMNACYFRDFMHYLYTGTISELTYDKAKTLYEAGDKYAVRSLMLRCSEYLQDILSVENVFDCYVLSDAHSDQNLKDKIKTYILDKKMFLEDEYWEPFCETFPKFANEVYRMSYRKKN